MNSTQLFSQIEQMMATAKNEAANVEEWKLKAKEADELRLLIPDLQSQVAAAKEMNYSLRRTMGELERQNAQLRHDMQSLNDIYHSEHAQFLSMQQTKQTADNEVLRLKHELAHSKNEASKSLDLRSSHESLAADAATLKRQIESLKAVNATLAAEKEAHMELHKQDREKLVLQLANSEEEAQRLRTAAEDCVYNEEAMRIKMKMQETQYAQGADRATMAWEDRAAGERRVAAALAAAAADAAALRREVVLLRAEVQALQDASVDAETQFIAATAGLKEVIAKHDTEMAALTLKATETKEVVTTLKAQNQELDQEVTSLRMKHFAATVEVRTVQTERAQCQVDVARLEAEKKQLEGTITTLQRSAEGQMDEAMAHMRSMGAQNEALQAQLTEAQRRYWEDMTKAKEAEAALHAEADALKVRRTMQCVCVCVCVLAAPPAGPFHVIAHFPACPLIGPLAYAPYPPCP
jgi:chromosome segregation ATPase